MIIFFRIFLSVAAVVLSTANAADTNFGQSLLSGKELKVVMTQVFNCFNEETVED